MPELIGLIPAAGIGSRLGAKGSKELVAVGDPRGSANDTRPVVSCLLDAMGDAGIERAYLVLRRGKWDVPERLSEGAGPAPRLAYVITEPTRSIPETLNRARPFVRGCDVLVGFPDVVFGPASAARELSRARRRSGDDVMVALFPSDRPDKTDMIEVDGARVTGFRIKPGPCELDYTWVLATWGDRFTDFLDAYLARTGGAPPPGSPLPELQISHVMEAALEAGLTIGGHAVPEGVFIDVGTPEDLARAQVAAAIGRAPAG